MGWTVLPKTAGYFGSIFERSVVYIVKYDEMIGRNKIGTTTQCRDSDLDRKDKA